jgi:hypothetical protein
LGILSITNPVNEGALEVRTDGKTHWALINGRCDGLNQILRSFDVWVLLRSEMDSKLWVQQPAALVDYNSNTWSAKIVFGDKLHVPVNESRWTIVAVAATPDSNIGSILNTPRLSLLPPHVSSNVVMIEIKIVKISET